MKINSPLPSNIAAFAPRVLKWWHTHGRKDLPWQRDPTPYRVWVSEIMLQQTQVTHRRATTTTAFMQFALPMIAALAAAAQEQRTRSTGAGLGYYSARPQSAHGRAAGRRTDTAVQSCHYTIDELVALARYRAVYRRRHLVAVSSRAAPAHPGWQRETGLGARLPGGRLVRFDGQPEEALEFAEICTPHDRVANYTQAIMDLGATLCTRAKPGCAICPLQTQCAAYAAGLVSAIPAPKPKKVRPVRAAVLVMAISRSGGNLLEKRPPSGIWGGLWSFPKLILSTL